MKFNDEKIVKLLKDEQKNFEIENLSTKILLKYQENKPLNKVKENKKFKFNKPLIYGLTCTAMLAILLPVSISLGIKNNNIVADDSFSQIVYQEKEDQIAYGVLSSTSIVTSFDLQKQLRKITSERSLNNVIRNKSNNYEDIDDDFDDEFDDDIFDDNFDDDDNDFHPNHGNPNKDFDDDDKIYFEDHIKKIEPYMLTVESLIASSFTLTHRVEVSDDATYQKKMTIQQDFTDEDKNIYSLYYNEIQNNKKKTDFLINGIIKFGSESYEIEAGNDGQNDYNFKIYINKKENTYLDLKQEKDDDEEEYLYSFYNKNILNSKVSLNFESSKENKKASIKVFDENNKSNIFSIIGGTNGKFKLEGEKDGAKHNFDIKIKKDTTNSKTFYDFFNDYFECNVKRK